MLGDVKPSKRRASGSRTQVVASTCLVPYAQKYSYVLDGMMPWASIIIIQIIQLALIAVYEKVEFDTFTYYFTKVELKRFAIFPIQINLSFVQEFIPIGWSKIQMLFQSSPYFNNAANYICCLLPLGLVVLRYRTWTSWFLIIALANGAFFTQYSGYKNDAPLAALGVGLTLIASERYFKGQICLLITITNLMLSIKWTAGLIILPCIVMTISRLRIGELRKIPISILIDLFCSVIVGLILANYLELGVYIQTALATRNLAPVQTLGLGVLSPSLSNLVLGVLRYNVIAIVESVEPVWLALSFVWSWTTVRDILHVITGGTKTYIVTGPNQIYQSLSVVDALAFCSLAVTLRCKNRFVRMASITSGVYFCIGFAIYPFFGNVVSRYFLPAQLLAYVSLSYQIHAAAAMVVRGRSVRSRESCRRGFGFLLGGAHLVVSMYMIVLDKHRNMLPVLDAPVLDFRSLASGDLVLQGGWRRPVWQEDDIMRKFRGWQGYQDVYRAVLEFVPRSEPMMVYFDSKSDLARYTYPFLVARDAANTELVDMERVEKRELRLRPGFVLCFGDVVCNSLRRVSGIAEIRSQGPHIALLVREG